MTIEQQQEAIRKGIRDILPCPPIVHRYYFADAILAFLTDNGAVLRVTGEQRWKGRAAQVAPLTEKK